MAATFLGAAFQFPGAGCGSKILNNFNPCGTILNCDPLEYDLAFSDGFPDYDVDPTCTIPGFCDEINVPFPVSPGGGVGTLVPGGTTGTGNTTGTGTGTGQ